MPELPKPLKAPRSRPRLIPRRARIRHRQPNPLGDYRCQVKEADRLFSKYVRLRDGRCRLCGETQGLQCAHLFSRRYRATRWDVRNAWALDARCHMKWTHDPLGWDDLLRQHLGGEYEVLKTMAQGRGKADMALLLPYLRGLLASVELSSST